MRSGLIVVMLMGTAAPTLAASIGIYSSPTCSGTASTVESGQSVVLFVMASTEDPPWGDGILFAEYRIVGIPEGWSVTSTPGPAVGTWIGDPLGGGVTMTYPTEQRGCVLLHTISVQARSAAQDVTLDVTAHTTPSWPPFDCPWLFFPTCYVACDPPPVCVEGIAHTLNPTVSTSRTGWSMVKDLYRN